MELQEILDLLKETRDALVNDKHPMINNVIDKVFQVLVLKFTNKFMEKEHSNLSLVDEFFKKAKKE